MQGDHHDRRRWPSGGCGKIEFERGGTMRSGSEVDRFDWVKERVNVEHVLDGVLERGRGRVSVGVGPDGAAVSLLDSEKKDRGVLGNVSLKTKKTGVVEKRPESSLVIFGTAGKVIWSAP